MRLILALIVFAPAPLLANSYFGRIVYTVTDSRVVTFDAAGDVVSSTALLSTNSIFEGFYSYESPTMDGSFARSALTGAIALPEPFALRFPGLGGVLDFSSIQSLRLVVSDGQVQSFKLGLQVGPFQTSFTDNTFSMGCGFWCNTHIGGPGMTMYAIGTVVVENPELVTTTTSLSVPEPPSVWLLGIIPLLFWLRTHHQQHITFVGDRRRIELEGSEVRR